jgi:hypothetical protein
MIVPDRSLKLLADRGIRVSENEWFGIKLHDGMYEEANKAYYINYNPDSGLRTNLPYVLHQADLLASRVEKNKQESEDERPVSNTLNSKKTRSDKQLINETDKDALKNTFDKLFN